MNDLFPVIPEDFAALSAEELSAFITETSEALRRVTAAPSEFVTDELTSAQLLDACRDAHAALADATTALAAIEAEPEETPEDLTDEEFASEMAELANDVRETEDEPEPDEPAETDEPETAAAEAVTAAAAPAAKPAKRPLPRPGRDRRAPEAAEQLVPLTAAAGAPDYEQGQPFPDMTEISLAMMKRRRSLGIIPEGTSGETIPIVRADWREMYPEERRLGEDPMRNQALVAAALDPEKMKAELARRREGSLTAAGGLCAPVTPYYQLQMLSQASRPVRGALASFNADRGGIRYARPPLLTSITDGVGIRTATEDSGDDTRTKTCQAVDCPDFEETDVNIIFHCLQFSNLGSRTFPERVTQANNLTLAAHARLAESTLLTGIDHFSTNVTAGAAGMGVSASYLGSIMAAADGMRSRHRMDPQAALRILLPWWLADMVVSDVYRSQFDRWSVDRSKLTALLRQANIEPSYYIDSASGRGQVFGTQSAGELLSFPDVAVSYLYPEGSFLYLDGGTLELGIVRDSVLNSTNDFQIFGETFENVAYIGIESLALVTEVCDSGAVSAPAEVGCPVDYTFSS